MYNLRNKDDGSSTIEKLQSDHSLRDVMVFTPEGFADNNTRNTVEVKDDFLATAIANLWTLASGASGTNAAISDAVAGVIELETGNGDTSVSANASTFAQRLMWRADRGRLTLEGRIALSSLTNSILFFGFTDTVANEMPFEVVDDEGNTLTATASDAAGIIFDARAEEPHIFLAGVSDSGDGELFDTGLGMFDDEFFEVKITVEKNGTTVFYINGKHVGTLNEAFRPTIPVTPAFVASLNTSETAKVKGLLDWVTCRMLRGVSE